MRQEHQKLLLNKEWLVAVDAPTSTPYLCKFTKTSQDLYCILVTNTKAVWFEILSVNQITRRWCHCNQLESKEPDQEFTWKKSVIELLLKSHTLGGFPEFSFEVGNSQYADLAFEMECEAFNWRWELCYIGHKSSAELISKQLILPLISVNAMAFSSVDAVSEMGDSDVEKAVDRVARTARRSIDTHLRHALSKPRFATTLRRMAAMFNFSPNLPEITSEVEAPDLAAEYLLKKTLVSSPVIHGSPLPLVHPSVRSLSPIQQSQLPPTIPVAHKSNPPMSSPTESEPDYIENIPTSATKSTSSIPTRSKSTNGQQEETHTQKGLSRHRSGSKAVFNNVRGSSESDSSSSLVRVPKKPRISLSDDRDNNDRSVLQTRATTSIKRGTRQPIKRGGKRF